MIKQIYQPLVNALNYEKSIIDEIAKVGGTQYNISHLFNFSSSISVTVTGGTVSVLGEISESLSLTSKFTNALESSLTETLSLQPQFINQLESELNATTILTFGSTKSQPLTATLNFSSSVESEFSYLMDFTKNISETISMDKTRVHYVYDGGITLQLP